MMADDLLSKVHAVSDLELATLLCLICREHCIISTEEDYLDHLVQELQLITSITFALKPVVIECHSLTTLDDFAAAIQLTSSPIVPRPTSPSRQQSHLSTHNPQASFSHALYHNAQKGRLGPLTPGGDSNNSRIRTASPSAGVGGHVANVVLAKNLNHAPKAVQIQALELVRTRRLFTHSSMLVAPRQFLLVAVLSAPSGGEARLTTHLNDFFYIAHWHDPEDGFENLEAAALEFRPRAKVKAQVFEMNSEGPSDLSSNYDDGETASLESVVRTKRGGPSESGDIQGSGGSGNSGGDEAPIFTDQDLATLARLSDDVSVDVDVLRYQVNVVTFLRLHRAVAGGISPTATKHFQRLMRCLATLHGIDFVTPALVGLAAKKIYLHRIEVTKPEKERSVQWGSDVRAIRDILHNIGPENIIDDILEMVAIPL